HDDDKPEGWQNVAVSQLVDLIGGGTPKTSVPEYWDGEIPWFSVADTPVQADVFVVDTEKRITRRGLENSSTRLLAEDTTIITARGTVGKTALAGKEMAMNQSCYGIKGHDGYPPYFIFFLIQSVVQTLQGLTHGAVFDTITRNTFEV